MTEPELSERDLPSAEDMENELGGRIERDIIQLHPIPDAEWRTREKLFLVDSPLRQEIAESIGRYFKRETPYDFPPYSAGDESSETPVYLIRTTRVGAVVAIAAGALGMRRVQGEWILKWIWIHPWERGQLGDGPEQTANLVFRTLDELYGDFLIEGPISPAMRRLMEKRGYDSDRVVHVG